jgi:hypothetical protein
MFIGEKRAKENRRLSDLFIRQGAAGLSDFVLWANGLHVKGVISDQ